MQITSTAESVVLRPVSPDGGRFALDLPLGGCRNLLPPPRVLRFGLTLSGLSVLAPFAALYTYYWILDRQGAQAAGWMQAAIGISLAVRGVLGAAPQIYLTPRLNAGGTWAERMQSATRFQHAWCLLTGLLLPPLLLGAQWAVHLLYAQAFDPATRYVFLFVLAEVIGLLAGTYQGLVVAADRMRFHVTQSAAAQGILLGVAWATMPSLGIAGAALGALAAQVFLFVCTSAYLWARMGLRPAARTTALTAYLVVALAGCGWFGAAGLALELQSLAASAAVYLALVVGLFAFVSADERVQLQALAARLTRRR